MTADALRHRTATSTDLQRGLCPTTQLIQPADTLPRGLPLTISSSRLTALVITDEASPFALRSIRNRLRRAVRRGAADRRRSDGTVACWWGSSLACWRWPHRRAVMVAERRMRCPPTGTRFGVQQVVGSSWRPRCPDACRGLVALSASSVSVHASGVRCPSEHPVSAQVMSTIRCPLSGVDVRCPGVGVRASRVRVRGVCIGDFVERVGAAAATRPGGAGSGRPAVPPNGSTICVSQRGFWSGLSGVAADA